MANAAQRCRHKFYVAGLRRQQVCVKPKGHNGRCAVYERRPAICRIWGVAESLPCPHGCEPERWLSDAEAAEILRAVLRAEAAA